MKDLIIIGGGPAGLTAAIYAIRQNIDFWIITENIGGQAALSAKIENYVGFRMISGAELISKFGGHAEKFGVDIKENVRVERIQETDGGFKIFTSDGECCSAKVLLIATGAKPRKLNAKGEEKFANRGVTYCAICDGPLFKGKDVAVIGGGNSALDAARQLAEMASKVYIITIEQSLRGESAFREKVVNSPNVTIITKGNTKEILGGNFVEGIIVETDDGEKKIEVQGVFVEIGWIPSADFLDIADKNERGEIIVDLDNRTTRKGIFAAGDVTNVSKKQIIIAAGDGAKAALNAIDYLASI
jgi:alkyl hydroperoxide reductase subunit F